MRNRINVITANGPMHIHPKSPTLGSGLERNPTVIKERRAEPPKSSAAIHAFKNKLALSIFRASTKITI